jgi:hypothetical protein
MTRALSMDDFARVRATGARAVVHLVLRAHQRLHEHARHACHRVQSLLEPQERLRYAERRTLRGPCSPLPAAHALAFSP